MPEQKKILIVDDEIDLCILLKDYFVRRNSDVYIANTLEEGLSLLSKNLPDILFLDNNLPDGTAWNRAPQIALDYPDMFIVLISAFHPTLPLMPQGAHFKVMEKPISMSELNKQLS